VPPLRERREDIPALVDAFVADFNRRTGGSVRGVSPAALEALRAHDWPGNVRELRNAVEGACVLASGETVEADDLEHLRAARRARAGGRAPAGRGAVASPARSRAASAPRTAAQAPHGSVAIPLGCTLEEAERRFVLANLSHHGTRARTARALGIGLRTLYTKLAAWGGDGAETA
jgi:DNA-binding NtrC family response regulator